MEEDKAKKGPTSFFDLGHPALAMLLETDVPDVMFQPAKAMAIAQIDMMRLINKRMLAGMALPRELMVCRTPAEVYQAQLHFFQTALQDYSDAVSHMAAAWEKAVQDQDGPKPKEARGHDYLTVGQPTKADERGAGGENKALQKLKSSANQNRKASQTDTPSANL